MEYSNLENGLDQLHDEAERLHRMVVEEAKKGNFAPVEQLKEFAEKLYTIIVQSKLKGCTSLEELDDFSIKLNETGLGNQTSLSKVLEVQNWFTSSVKELRRTELLQAPPDDPVIPRPPKR